MRIIYCEHANEVPMVCPCTADCVCRKSMCKGKFFPKNVCPGCGEVTEILSGLSSAHVPRHCVQCRKLRFAEAVSEMCDVVDDGPGDGFTPETYALVIVDKLKELHETFIVQGI